MSTSLLIAITIVTAFAALAALTFNRWLEQRRLERLRQAVLHSDNMNKACLYGEELSKWLSPEALQFIARVIQYHQKQIQLLGIPPNARTKRAAAMAEEWQNTPPPPLHHPMPKDLKKAQALRQSIISLLELVKEAYANRIVETDLARQVIKEGRMLNTRICIGVYQARAQNALKQNNTNQAIHFLKRAETALQTLGELPHDLQELMNALSEEITNLEQLRHEAHTSSRLSEEAEELAEADEAWKKKNYD
jgi:hypothetical protein